MKQVVTQYGLLVLTDDEREKAIRRGQSVRHNRRCAEKRGDKPSALKEYFKIGVSPDYILIRDDFPINEISPSDFSRLCAELFRQNDEVFSDDR